MIGKILVVQNHSIEVFEITRVFYNSSGKPSIEVHKGSIRHIHERKGFKGFKVLLDRDISHAFSTGVTSEFTTYDGMAYALCNTFNLEAGNND